MRDHRGKTRRRRNQRQTRKRQTRRRGGGVMASRLKTKKPKTVAPESPFAVAPAAPAAPITLAVAIENNDFDRVANIFVENPAICQTDKDECTNAFERALQLGNMKIIETFLNNPEMKAYASQNQSLEFAILEGTDDPAIFTVFQNAGIFRPNMKFSSKDTPLHLAAEYGMVNLVHALLKQPGINVNAKNAMGYTPLSITLIGDGDISDQKKTEIVTALLELPTLKIDAATVEYVYDYDPGQNPLADLIRSKLVAEYNEAPIALATGKPPITILSSKRIANTYIFETDGRVFTVKTMILPKGTILFRGTNEDPVENFYGIASPKTGKYHLHSNYNVFFYPHPFASKTIGISYDNDNIYVLTNDVEIVMAIEPSVNTRANRLQEGYLVNCDLKYIESTHEAIEGRNYDACFNPEFIKQHPEIVGYIGLAKQDTEAHLSRNYTRPIFQRKYWTYFRDANGSVGIPEIVLYPLNRRSPRELVMALGEETPYPHNYKRIKSYSDGSTMQRDLDRFLSPDGLEGKHMTIDLATKMYVLWEDASEEIKGRCVPIEEPNKLKWFNHNLDI